MSEWHEGTYDFTGNPWEHDYCDLLVLESNGESAEGKGDFKSKGLFLNSGFAKINFSN